MFSWVRGPSGKAAGPGEERDDSPWGQARPHPGTVLWCARVIGSVCERVSLHPPPHGKAVRNQKSPVCSRPWQERAVPEAEPGGIISRTWRTKGTQSTLTLRPSPSPLSSCLRMDTKLPVGLAPRRGVLSRPPRLRDPSGGLGEGLKMTDSLPLSVPLSQGSGRVKQTQKRRAGRPECQAAA